MKRLLFVTLAVTLGLAAAELLVRTVGFARYAWFLLTRADAVQALERASRPQRPSLHRVYELCPGFRGTFTGVEVAVDGNGFRSSRAIGRQRTPGSLRVAAVGDSVTFGYGVAQGQTYPERLEAVLGKELRRPVEVINAGVPGYTSRQALAYAVELLDFGPDVFVVCVGWNDLMLTFRPGWFRGCSYYMPASFAPPTASTARGRVLESLSRSIGRSRFISMVAGWFAPPAPVITDPDVLYDTCGAEGGPVFSRSAWEGRRVPLNAAALADFRRNLRALVLAARSGGARVALMTWPTPPVTPASNGAGRSRPPLRGYAGLEDHLPHYDRAIRETARETGAVLVDTAGLFAQADAASRYFLDACHPDGEGDRLVAEHVARALAASGAATARPAGPVGR